MSEKHLHLGAGKNPLPTEEGWVNLDMVQLPGIDVVCNLDECGAKKLPFEDDTFDGIFGSHVLEHIHNTLPFMQELHRVAKKDSLCIFKLPYGSSDDAWENPTHVRPYFVNSFGYFGQPNYWREDYGFTGDWAPERIVLRIEKAQYGETPDVDLIFRDVMTKRNVVSEMVVTLRCVKPIRPQDKSLQVVPKLEFVLV